MTQENTYESPKSALIDTGNSEIKKVLVIAEREKRLIYAILVHLIIVIFKASVRDEIRPILVFIHPIIILALIVFSARLFICFYGKITSLAMVILSLIPGVNLILWGVTLYKSHKYIKSNGFKVGILGARLKDIKSAI